jgi:hypothetical protein
VAAATVSSHRPPVGSVRPAFRPPVEVVPNGTGHAPLGFPKMCGVTNEEREGFPTVGSRARMLKRFERDLRRWLETPEGRFAAWHAQQTVEEPQPEPADR